MKGRHLLLVVSLAFGAGIGVLIAGAPWDTPNDPVQAFEVETTTTTTITLPP